MIDFYIFTWSLSTMQWSLVSSRTYFVDFCNFPQKQPCHGQTKSFISSFPICVLFNSFGSPVLFSSPILLNYLWYFFLYQVVFYSLFFFSSLNLAVFLGNSPVVQQLKDPAGVQVTNQRQKQKTLWYFYSNMKLQLSVNFLSLCLKNRMWFFFLRTQCFIILRFWKIWRYLLLYFPPHYLDKWSDAMQTDRYC